MNLLEFLGVLGCKSNQLQVSVYICKPAYGAKNKDALFIGSCNGIRTRDYVGRLEDHTRLIPRFCCDWRSLYSFVEGNLKVRLQTLHFQRHPSPLSSGMPFHQVVVSLFLGYAVCVAGYLVSQPSGLIFPRV